MLREKDGKIILLKDNGSELIEIKEITTTKKVYNAPKGFLPLDIDFELKYIYEHGEYSIPRYKYIMHIGSSRSSKSWSIEEWCIRKCETIKNLRINIWRDTRTSLGDTIWKDFKKLFPLSGRSYKFTRNTVPLHFEGTDSIIEPHGADVTNAHGITQDIAWLNEPYLIGLDTFNQIDQRCEQMIIDLNPKENHWSDDLQKHPRCKVIHSTFMLNPFCPPEQKRKILSYDPNNPINVDNNTADAYMHSVYALGEKAERPNRIFRFTEIPDSQYHELDKPIYYGIDWGKVHNMGVIEVKTYDNDIYVHEINYKSEDTLRNDLTATERRQIDRSEDEGFVQWLCTTKFNIPFDRPVVCDNNRRNKIISLRKIGYDYAVACRKFPGSLLDNIDLLTNLNVYYTRSSVNIAYEQENYSRKVDKRSGEVLEEPEDKDDHLMQPLSYVVRNLYDNDVLRKF